MTNLSGFYTVEKIEMAGYFHFAETGFGIRLVFQWNRPQEEKKMKTTLRRKNQALSEEECVAVLRRRTSGVLAAAGEDDYPYAVPLSYVYCDFKLYFH